MSDKKKTTNKKKFRINDNVLRILNIIFAVIAVVSLVATILLSPIGDKILNGNRIFTTKTVTDERVKDNLDGTEFKNGLYYNPSLDSYYWPEPTEPIIDELTTYRVFVNTIRFNYTNVAGVTTVTAKEDPTAVMVITPLVSVDYASLTESISAEMGDPTGEMLEQVEISCCYSSEKDGYKTVVYCVDDLRSGSFEIRYTLPTGYENSYESQFEMMLEMFQLAY